MTRVLVAEKIGDSGVELLREQASTSTSAFDWTRDELDAAHRRVRRDPHPLGDEGRRRPASSRRRNLRVDRPRRRRRRQRRRPRRDQARHRRRQRAAVERRHRRRAHDGAAAGARAQRPAGARRARRPGRWERSKFSRRRADGQDARHPRLRAHRPARRRSARRASACTSSPTTRSSATERYRELGVEQAETLRRRLRRGRLPHAAPAQDAGDRGLARRRGVRARCSDGVRILNVARGPLIVDEDLQAALDSGKVGGAALDVFRSEPITEHPLFGYPNVVVTPHLGASTAEATDRAGYQAAEQVVAALQRRQRHDARSTCRRSRPRTSRCSARSCRCAASSAGWRSALAEGVVGRPRSRSSCLGRIAERDTRPLAIAVAARRARGPHRGGRQRGQRARRSPRSAGSRSSRSRTRTARDFTDLVRVTVVARRASASASSARRSAASTARTCSRPGASASTSSSSRTSTLFRYRDVPGMIGRVGTTFGDARHQHRLGRRRPHARRRRRRATGRRSWSSRPTRRCPQRRGRRDRRRGGLRGGPVRVAGGDAGVGAAALRSGVRCAARPRPDCPPRADGRGGGAAARARTSAAVPRGRTSAT